MMNTPAQLRKFQRYIKKLRQQYSLKGLLLYFLPLPAVLAAIVSLFRGDLAGIIINAGCYALYLYAAWLLRLGLAAETQYRKKSIILAPQKPLKFNAAIVVALATGLIAWMGAEHSLLISIVFAGAAFLGMYLTYGFDPRTEKTISGSHGYSTEEISLAIKEAEKLINEIDLANDRIGNNEFNIRIDRICNIAKQIVKEIEQDPADLRRSRKFLKVYLEGARKVTEGYASTHQQADSRVLEENFSNLLDKIETVFLQQQEALLENDVFDLDVQIEVLATQLKHEGFH